MAKRTPKTLVLGEGSYPRGATSFSWQSLPGGLNVADYDAVVLNLVTASGKVEADHARIPTVAQFTRLLFSHGGRLIIVGNPTILVGQSGRGYSAFHGFLPFQFDVTRESGEEVQVSEDDLSYYFDWVTRWQFWIASVKASPAGSKELKNIHPSASGLRVVERQSIAATRFHQPISIRFSADAPGASGRVAPVATQPILVLPPTQRLTSEEAVAELLRRELGVGATSKMPEWTRRYRLPAEAAPQSASEKARDDIRKATKRLEKADAELSRIRVFQRLLYEQGEPLEDIVLETLKLLGATLGEVESPNKEDGRITDPSGRNYVLEVKGRKGTAAVRDVRQVDQWSRDAIAGGWECRGLLVLNPLRETPLSEREGQFPDNVKKLARRFEVPILLTSQLYQALADKQSKVFDEESFWATVAETHGPVPYDSPSQVGGEGPG